MVVQHNLTAMNSNRQLGLTTSAQAKSTEKLSSGYKINRAADDAAGLSISEKMRKQIRGLTQASANAEDGISAVQTAEGALNEVQDMLQRMNELAVKSSNGTMSENDRSYVQNEVDQLVAEIDRVSETTKFNETYLLKGNTELTSATAATNATPVAGVTTTLAGKTVTNAGDYSVGTVGMGTATAITTAKSLTGINSATIDSSNVDLVNLMNKATTSGELKFTVATVGSGGTPAANFAATTWSISDDANTLDTVDTATLASKYGITLTQDGTTLQTAAQNFTLSKNMTTSATQTADLSKQGISTAGTATAIGLKDYSIGQDVKVTISENATTAGQADISAYSSTKVPSTLTLSLHVGADSTTDNKISVGIDSMSAKGLGIRTSTGDALKVDGKDSTSADNAIDVIASAIQKVSTQRSSLGAVQNRLEHTINNLDNVVENTTSAESAIRDTDMATEMVKYSNNNILTQAGQAMLAQANQSNQGVLSLLQ